MEYLKYFENINPFDEEEWDEEEFDGSRNFEYVSPYGKLSHIYVSLKKVKNGNLKIFNNMWTKGWDIKNFIPVNVDGMNIIKNEDKSINFYIDGRWSSLSYKNFVKKYPQFKI